MDGRFAGGRRRFPRQRGVGIDTGRGEVPKMLVRAPVVVAGEPLGECGPQGGEARVAVEIASLRSKYGYLRWPSSGMLVRGRQ